MFFERRKKMNLILMLYCFVGIYLLIIYLTAKVFHDYKTSFLKRLAVYAFTIYLAWKGLTTLNDVVVMALLGELPETPGRDWIFLFSIQVITYFIGLSMIEVNLFKKEISEKIKKLPFPAHLTGWTMLASGEKMPFYCQQPNCQGAIIKTEIFTDCKQKFPDWKLQRIKQQMLKDRFFCLECGTEHIDCKTIAPNPFNLHELTNLVS